MKKIISFFAILMMVMAIPQSVKAYDFSYTYQGQTLYYKIVNGEAKVTYQNNGSTAYTNLSGALVIPDTVTYNGTTYSVTSIGDYAFRGCSGLTSVTIPNSVTSIGNYAFAHCSGLTSVTIGNSVTSIGYLAFYGCSGLTSVTIPNSVTSIGSNAFSGCSGLTSVTIGNSVTSIDYMAFYGCSGLTSVTIPNSVTFIDQNAFSGCSGLTSVIFNADSCTSAGSYNDWVFDGCINITNFTFGNNVRVIPPYLCWGLSSLTSVTIGNSVTSIGNSVFYGCSGLIEVTMLGEIAPTLGSSVFSQNGSSRIIKIPCGSYDSYYNGSGWSSYRSALHEHSVDITLTIGSNDSIKGIASIIQQDGRDVACDSSAIIRATPSYGYHFDHWSNGNTANPDTLHLVGDSTVTAIFALNQYVLTVQSADESLGSVAGSGTYDYLDTVSISATANNHHHFVHWSDGSTDNPHTIAVTQDMTLTAYFVPNQYALAVASSDETRGHVSGSGNYDYLSICTISATANYGYHFTQWNDGVAESTRTITLIQDTSFAAHFAPNQYLLTVTAGEHGTASGSGTYDYLDTVSISATAINHHHFVQWSDGNRDNPRQVVVTGDMIFSAYFAIDTHTVNVVTSDTARGMVETTGTEFGYGTPCTVTATAYTGYIFAGWSNGVTANPYTFAVLSDVELTALFVAEGEDVYTVTVESADPTMGTVSGGGQALGGGTVTIRAAGNPGYHFLRWNDNNTDSIRTVEVHGNATYTAYFEADNAGLDEVDVINAKIYTIHGQIVVEGTEDNTVWLYDVNGRILAIRRDEESHRGMPLRFDVPASGTYLIKIGTHPARKVVVIR